MTGIFNQLLNIGLIKKKRSSAAHRLGIRVCERRLGVPYSLLLVWEGNRAMVGVGWQVEHSILK